MVKSPPFVVFQDKVEEADSGGTRVTGGNWKLRGPAADVPVPVLLPAEPSVQPGPRSGPLPLQGPLGSPAGPAETPCPADLAARPAGGQRAAPATSSAPTVRRASSAHSAVSGPPYRLGFIPLNSSEQAKTLKRIKTWWTRKKKNCSRPVRREMIVLRWLDVADFFSSVFGTWALFMIYLFLNMNQSIYVFISSKFQYFRYFSQQTVVGGTLILKSLSIRPLLLLLLLFRCSMSKAETTHLI